MRRILSESLIRHQYQKKAAVPKGQRLLLSKVSRHDLTATSIRHSPQRKSRRKAGFQFCSYKGLRPRGPCTWLDCRQRFAPHHAALCRHLNPLPPSFFLVFTPTSLVRRRSIAEPGRAKCAAANFQTKVPAASVSTRLLLDAWRAIQHLSRAKLNSSHRADDPRWTT